jgi:SAM-dependent methyltransferase
MLTAADVRALPFEDASFDVVVANHVLYHVDDMPRALAEIRRVLSPRGRLIASTIGRNHMRQLEELAERFAAGPRTERLAERFGLEAGGAHLGAAFTEVEVDRYDDRLGVNDPDAVVAYIRTMDEVELSAIQSLALRAEVSSMIRR